LFGKEFKILNPMENLTVLRGPVDLNRLSHKFFPIGRNQGVDDLAGIQRSFSVLTAFSLSGVSDHSDGCCDEGGSIDKGTV
jgi:hypothetical protein